MIETNQKQVKKEKTEQDLQTEELIRQIRRLMHAEFLYSKELDRTYNVSSPQLSCLRVLDQYGPLPPSQIARLILLKSSTVTGIIDRLEFKGFVQRIRNSRDRRVIMIEMTEKGEDLVKSAPPPIQKRVLDRMAELPPEKMEHIIHSLKILNEMFDI